jgi:hypothetical protein
MRFHGFLLLITCLITRHHSDTAAFRRAMPTNWRHRTLFVNIATSVNHLACFSRNYYKSL